MSFYYFIFLLFFFNIFFYHSTISFIDLFLAGSYWYITWIIHSDRDS